MDYYNYKQSSGALFYKSYYKDKSSLKEEDLGGAAEYLRLQYLRTAQLQINYRTASSKHNDASPVHWLARFAEQFMPALPPIAIGIASLHQIRRVNKKRDKKGLTP